MKNLFKIITLLILWCFTATCFALSPEEMRIAQGLKIAPVPLKISSDALKPLIGLGSYIVNAQAACADCHSCPQFAPGHNPYYGQTEQVNTVNYLAGGRAFGPFISVNLTPNAGGYPAGLTWLIFKKVMQTGISSKGNLLQVHPAPIYNKMLDRDLLAIYQYLRAIPTAQPANVADPVNCP